MRLNDLFHPWYIFSLATIERNFFQSKEGLYLSKYEKKTWMCVSAYIHVNSELCCKISAKTKEKHLCIKSTNWHGNDNYIPLNILLKLVMVYMIYFNTYCNMYWTLLYHMYYKI